MDWNNKRINVVWDTMESTPKKNTICYWFAMRRIQEGQKPKKFQ